MCAAPFINIDTIVPSDYKLKFKQKHFLAPKHPARIIVTGPSGKGKSNIVFNLILQYMYFDKLYIYAKALDEDKYRFLVDIFKKVEKDIERDLIKSHVDPQLAKQRAKVLTISNTLNDAIKCDDLDPEIQNLIVIDDMITEGPKAHIPIEDLYIRCRKKNTSIIYITQSYHDVPSVIRKQANYVIITGIDNKRELIEMQKDHASRVSKDTFLKLYQDVANTKYAFMMIDKETDLLPLRIRKNLDGLYIPEH